MSTEETTTRSNSQLVVNPSIPSIDPTRELALLPRTIELPQGKYSKLNTLKTRDIQHDWKKLIDLIKESVVDRLSVDDVIQRIDLHLQDTNLKHLHTIDDIFNDLQADFLKWHDAEALGTICQRLEVNNTLDQQRQQYKEKLRKYFTNHSAEIIIPERKETKIQVNIDDAWDHEDLRENCQKVCLNIINILEQNIEQTLIHECFEDPFEYLNIIIRPKS